MLELDIKADFLMKISKNMPFPWTLHCGEDDKFRIFSLAYRRGVPGRFAKWDRLIATFCATSHRFDDLSGNIIFIFLYKFVLDAWLEE